ncbi:MAG: hypothetical protein IPP46_17395 [Bacteroidetes bacterium]|nr:hypothetical protein [Bacteroidota bacterium]
MRSIFIITSIVLHLFIGQQVALAQAPKLKLCAVPTDSAGSTKVTLKEAQEWADNLPLKVVCNDGKIYQLNQFLFTMITMNPLQTKEYGLANNGIPILARKAIDQMKKGDTIFLKEVQGKDASGTEIKLPNIVFVVKEEITE